MSRAKAVTVIPATLQKFSSAPMAASRKKRVAGYARVSTDNDEQLTSYEAQVDYYTTYIKGNPEWAFVDVYTDEGISATNTKKRDGFNRMIADALAGEIDLIVTKSVSRFARNTVDSLTTIRRLKEKGVAVWFEKENIDTSDAKGELLITIMSSLAQEESRSISENVTWGQRKRFADGKVSMPYKQFLGYDKGEDGLPQINNEEAETARLIYRLFLEGGTPHSIAKHLTAERVPSPGGKDRWMQGTVRSILTNEKYKGDALLQKKYTVDFLTKKQKVNEGEIPQYYVENSHPAIIDPEVFDMVQQEMKRRQGAPGRYTGGGLLTGRILCGECGGYYGAKVWHSNSKYRRTIYRCNHKYSGGQKCKTPHVDEARIKTLFISAVNKLFPMKNTIIADFAMIQQSVFDTSALEIEQRQLRDEIEITAGLIQKCVDENAHLTLDQAEYQKKYEGLVSKFEEAKQQLVQVESQIHDKSMRSKQANAFLAELKKQPEAISTFDQRLWYTLLDTVTVYSQEDIRFTFKDGTEIQA